MTLFGRKKSPTISFAKRLEAYAPYLVATAWDFTERSPEIAKLWIYATVVKRRLLVEPVFKVEGKIHTCEELGEAFPHTSTNATEDLKDDLGNLLDSWLTQVRKDPHPTHMVLAFTPDIEALDANFSYEPLEVVEEIEGLDPTQVIFKKWLERLRITGDDSPDLN